MRFLQILIRKLIALAILIAGAALTVYHSSEIYQWMIKNVTSHPILRIGVAVIMIIVGLLALLPLLKLGRKRVIKFDGPHGSVTIQLDSVEIALNRAVAKMPEVKKLTAKVNSAVNDKKISITADALLYKGSDLGARETAAKISNYISDTAIGLLGMQELASVDLNVSILDKPVPGKAKLRRKDDAAESMPRPVETPEEPKAEITDEDYYLPVRQDAGDEDTLEASSVEEVETDEGFSPVTPDLLPSSLSTLDDEPVEIENADESIRVEVTPEEEIEIPDFSGNDSEDKPKGPGLDL